MLPAGACLVILLTRRWASSQTAAKSSVLSHQGGAPAPSTVAGFFPIVTLKCTNLRHLVNHGERAYKMTPSKSLHNRTLRRTNCSQGLKGLTFPEHVKDARDFGFFAKTTNMNNRRPIKLTSDRFRQHATAQDGDGVTVSFLGNLTDLIQNFGGKINTMLIPWPASRPVSWNASKRQFPPCARTF